MKNDFEKILNILEKINNLHNLTIPTEKLNEEREFIDSFKKDKQKLDNLLNELENSDLTHHQTVDSHLFALYLEVLDFCSIIRSLYKFSNNITKRCAIAKCNSEKEHYND